MHITPIESQNQTINPDKLGIFGDYFSKLKIGSMLNKSGITKTKGASPLELFTIVFNLAFKGKTDPLKPCTATLLSVISGKNYAANKMKDISVLLCLPVSISTLPF